MARIVSLGSELNSATTAVEWHTAFSGTAVDGNGVRSGLSSLHITSLSSGTSKGLTHQFLSAEASSKTFIRFYLRLSILPSAENRICLFNDSNSTSSPSVYVTVDSSGVIKLYDEDGQITGTTTLSTGVWYRVEVLIDTTTAGGSHEVRGRVDGVEFAGSSSRNIASTNLPFWVLMGGNLNSEANTSGDWFFDDVVINDNSGSFQNSYPGSGKIIHLKPNAAGDNSDWTNTYANVDEVTPDDASTLVSSNTLDQIDDHNIEAPAYLGDSDTVNVVQVGVRFNGAGASANASFVLRVKASASGTVEESSAITPSNTTWVTNAAAAPRNYPLTLYDLPGASTTAWTKADLTSAQIGYRLSSTSTNAAQISTVWLLVDYTPATASGVSLCFWKPYANQPPSSNYATLDTRNLHPVLDFNKTTQESAIFRGVMPRSYSGGDITVYLHWAATTVTTGTGGWDVAFERIGDGQQDIDSDGFAAAQQIGPDTVPATTGNVIITSVTMSNSACDSIAAGESFRLRVRRDVTNDNADDDLELLGVELRETA